jgi:hypothetical protein
MLVAGQILQDELFSGGEEEATRTERNARKAEPAITIDDSGIHINPRAKRHGNVRSSPNKAGRRRREPKPAMAANAGRRAPATPPRPRPGRAKAAPTPRPRPRMPAPS